MPANEKYRKLRIRIRRLLDVVIQKPRKESGHDRDSIPSSARSGLGESNRHQPQRSEPTHPSRNAARSTFTSPDREQVNQGSDFRSARMKAPILPAGPILADSAEDSSRRINLGDPVDPLHVHLETFFELHFEFSEALQRLIRNRLPESGTHDQLDQLDPPFLEVSMVENPESDSFFDSVSDSETGSRSRASEPESAGTSDFLDEFDKDPLDDQNLPHPHIRFRPNRPK